MMKIGMAFSGGGARGVAHIGVLKAFEENNIQLDVVSGTSAGSIVAALYANGFSSEDMMEFVRDTTIFKFFSMRLPTGGLVKTTFLEEKILKMIPHNDFAKLNIPLKIAVTNLTKGIPEIKEKGSIVNLPARVIKKDCNLLIGSNLIPYVDIDNHELTTMKEIGIRCFDLVVNQNTTIDVDSCDLIINHFGLRNMTLFSISKADEIFQIGYESALKIIPQLIQTLESKQ
ncbi:MAG: patatin-like phospholipase family protein [Saprospiraceae bacterium]|nr:patatin-like phospholipase family protein [Saprospiraceae bacterium]